MTDELASKIERHVGAISRALAYLCLNSPTMSGAGLGQQGLLLQAFGFDNKQIAAMLNSTPGAIAVRMAEVRKRKKEKS